MSKNVKIVDARMGRGKSSAAIRYMNENFGTKKFLYVTPFLDEVGRICEQCDFDQASGDYASKSSELKGYLRCGANVAATHALFYLLDDEALSIVRDQGYNLIIDENINVVGRFYVTNTDLNLVLGMTTEDEIGRLTWNDQEYTGRFEDCKAMANSRSLFHLDTALFSVLNPNLIQAFNEVYILTYMFDGQYQKAYLDFCGFTYDIIGIEEDNDGYKFSDKPDCPPPMDYSNLIRIWNNRRANDIGRGYWTLAKAWYERHSYDSPEMTSLRKSLHNFFHNVTDSTPGTRLWTTFKEFAPKLVNHKTHRYSGNFLQIGARATNEFRNRTAVAYMANRFADPNIVKFFAKKGCEIDTDKFAIAEMLQWVWRSAIRDDRPIDLYVPSERMRSLLVEWIDQTAEGGGRV